MAPTMVDPVSLREQVWREYRAVAPDPARAFRGHTGRAAARWPGYDAAAVAVLPDRSLFAAQQVGLDGRVVGVAVTPEMLEKASATVTTLPVRAGSPPRTAPGRLLGPDHEGERT
ncbi:hypothetical protein A7K94_0201865 [Modestobacter sp. VKM Ac-2676]|nr:hypothetical protein A7K94_0201865 [Modestobacter sp. VKM Ac-2676]